MIALRLRGIMTGRHFHANMKVQTAMITITITQNIKQLHT